MSLKSFAFQIWLSFVAFFVILIIWLLLFFKAEKKSEELSRFSFELVHLHNEFSENIINYQNFILSGFKNETFYTQNFQKDIDKYINNLKTIRKKLFVLEEHAEEYRLGSYSGFENIIISNSQLIQLGDSLKSLMKYRGFKDYGLEGKIRVSAHMLLEDNEGISRAEILQLRRHEKDFMLRGEAEYTEAFNTLLEKLKRESPKDSKVFNLLENYFNTFNEFVAVSNILNFYDDSGLLGEINTMHQDINYTFSGMKKKSSQRILELNQQNSNYLIIQTIFFIIIAIGVSFYLAKTLTHDIKLLNKNFRYFINSDFLKNEDKEIAKPSLKLSSIEIRNLFENFQLLKETLSRTIIKLNKEVKKSEKAADYKTKFLANMSHEIRTPLNGILGMLQVIKMEKLTGQQQENLRVAEYSANHLLDVVNMILDHSKLEVGKMRVEIEPVDLKLILKNLYEIFKYQAKEKNLDFQVCCAEDIPKKIKADSMRIQQVLMNLLSNAIKFTEVGSVTLTATKISEIDDEIIVRFEVIDTGVGINDENKTRLFKAFEQQDISTTRKYGGTGLGLTITNQLVELMEGQLNLESEINKGSRFYFDLSSKKIEEKEMRTMKLDFPQKVSFDNNNYKVLVVEDNKINQLVITKMLKNLGINYNIAKDGNEAHFLFLELDFDLILMDIHMPGMNGLEATKLIKSDSKYLISNPPIIATTASVFEEDKVKAFSHGMDDFLSKPVLFPNLLQTLKKHLPHFKGVEKQIRS